MTVNPVCLFCLKRFKRSNFFGAFERDEGRKLFRRFINFAERYLELPIEVFKVISEEENAPFAIEIFCEACARAIDMICQMYTELCTIQIKLAWSLKELGVLVESSTKAVSSKLRHVLNGTLTSQLQVGPGDDGNGSRCGARKRIDRFRTKLITRCNSKSKRNPHVIVTRSPPSPLLPNASEVIKQEELDDNDYQENFDTAGSEDYIDYSATFFPTHQISISSLAGQSRDEETVESKYQPNVDSASTKLQRPKRMTRVHVSKVNEFYNTSSTAQEGRRTPMQFGRQAAKKRKEKLAIPAKRPKPKIKSKPKSKVVYEEIPEKLEVNTDERSAENYFGIGLPGSVLATLDSRPRPQYKDDTSEDDEDGNPLPAVLRTPKSRRKKFSEVDSCSDPDFEVGEDEIGATVEEESKLDGLSEPVMKKKLFPRTVTKLRKPRREKPPKRILTKGGTRKRPRREPATEEEVEWLNKPCALCGAPFLSSQDLYRHLLEIHEERATDEGARQIACFFCPNKYVYEETRKIHLLRSHVRFSSSIDFNCKYFCDGESGEGCDDNKSFSCIEELNSHLATDHIGKQVHQCSTCEWQCLNEHALRLHELVHAPRMPGGHLEKKYCCPQCGLTFRYLEILREHFNQSHGAGLKMYSCTFCDKKYFHRKTRQAHIEARHSGPSSGQPLYCDQCGKSFSHKKLLKQHQTTHHQLLPCPDCGIEIVKRLLVKHRAELHGQDYMCQQCGKRFKCFQQVSRHVEAVHDNKKLKCLFCEAEFKSKSYMKTHVQRNHATEAATEALQRKHICAECGLSYFAKSTLSEHIFRKHREKFEILSEFKGKINQCPYCPEEFLRPFWLQRHIGWRHKDKVGLAVAKAGVIL